MFIHINWSAFFFGLNWVLYRKMYKVATIGFVITSLISILISIIFLLPHIEEIKSLNELITPFHQYVENGEQTILLDEQGIPYSPEIVQQGAQAEKKLNEIQTKAQLKSFFLIPFVCAFWGLFGDAIYKMHIRKNIKNKSGGTSTSALITGRLLLGAIELLALNPLIFLIAVMLAN